MNIFYHVLNTMQSVTPPNSGNDNANEFLDKIAEVFNGTIYPILMFAVTIVAIIVGIFKALSYAKETDAGKKKELKGNMIGWVIALLFIVTIPSIVYILLNVFK